MRAAVRDEQGSTPRVVADFQEPEPVEGAVLIEVTTAGLGAWDVLGMYREPIAFPCVIRGEGVGRAEDGRRVYFGERSLLPFGAWAERTVVPAPEVWDVPDDVDDRTAITMAIAATGAWVPLEQAAIKPGESVLVTGATGTVGQLALQLARHLGAGRVVGAGRDQKALARLVERGVADAVVRIGAGVDADSDALKAESGDGFDVVLDIVYGEPFLAALKATRFGARIMCMGAQAGLTANVPIPDLLYRTVTCVGTGQRAPDDRERIWRKLLDIAKQEDITVDFVEYTLDQAAEAWTAMAAAPHAKIIATIDG